MNSAREVKIERFSRTQAKEKRRHLWKAKLKNFGARSTRPRIPACAIAFCLGSLPTLRPDRRRREPEGRRLLSIWEAVFAPL